MTKIRFKVAIQGHIQAESVDEVLTELGRYLVALANSDEHENLESPFEPNSDVDVQPE